LRAITPFSACFARVCTTAPPSLHSHYRSFITTMQDSDFCPRRCGLALCRACAGRWSLRPTRTDLPGYLGCPSRHAIPADTAGTMGGLRRLSGPPLAAFAIRVAARLSGAFGFDAHWMGFTFVMACRFRRCPACRFRLAASSRTSLSVANRLIRPAGLSPAWLPASPAHTRNPKLIWCYDRMNH
jgi:hypothetical protein